MRSRTERRPLLRAFLTVLKAAALLVLVLPAVLLALRQPLIYPFWGGDARAVPGEIVAVPAPDGTPILVWRRPPAPGRPWVMHFGGNVGRLGDAVWHVSGLVDAGYGALVVNYRGAGGAAGAPSEEALVADALAVYDWAGFGPEALPVLYGWSLGAAVAVALAAERPAAALVLASPFSELCRAAEARMPWVPACALLWDERWESARRIRAVEAPVLVVHGARDAVIPASEGRRLAAIAGAPFLLLDEAGHVLPRARVTAEIDAFLARLP